MTPKNDNLLKTAVIEGFHPFEVPAFRDLFRTLDGVDPYHQTMENWAIDCAGMRKKYDVLLFYNSNQKMQPECDFCRPAVEASVRELGDTPGQGIVVLHHAILAYPESEEWSRMVGIRNRTFGFHMEQTFPVHVAAPEHPIVRGLADWSMFDETYTMDSAGEGSEILLTSDHEKSMTSIAWTRRHGESRVFCLQLGHDARSWADPNFREVLARGIRWAAGRE